MQHRRPTCQESVGHRPEPNGSRRPRLLYNDSDATRHTFDHETGRPTRAEPAGAESRSAATKVIWIYVVVEAVVIATALLSV